MNKNNDNLNAIHGNIHANCSFNNTSLYLYDDENNLIQNLSGGKLGYIGRQQGALLPAQQATEKIAIKALKLGFTTVDLHLKGMGRGRNSIAKSLQKHNLKIRYIFDRTPYPHNGCRPRKPKRG